MKKFLQVLKRLLILLLFFILGNLTMFCLLQQKEEVLFAKEDKRKQESENRPMDYFEFYRKQRDEKRKLQINVLQNTLQTEGLHSAQTDRLVRGIELFVAYTEKEQGIEKLLLAKGYEEAACLLNESKVEIIVRCPTFSEQDADVIWDIVNRFFDGEEIDVRIIPL